MFPSAPPPNHHVWFALKLSVRFTPPDPRPAPLKSQVWFTFKLPSPIYPQIICTIYHPPPAPPKSPSLIYLQIAKSDLPLNRLYDLPPRICQVRFTFKSASPIYPQIICTIYPPEIAKSDLPSNCLYDLPPEITKSDLPSNRLYDLPPQFEGKSDLAILGGGKPPKTIWG